MDAENANPAELSIEDLRIAEANLADREMVAAINQASVAIGTIARTGRNENQGYTYASEADYLMAINPALNDNGLILMPKFKVVSEKEITNKDGAKGYMVRMRCKLSIAHTGGALWRNWSVAESAGWDWGDKAENKAMTASYKYALAKAFAIPTHDDPEADASTDRVFATPSETRRQPNQQPAAQPSAQPAPPEPRPGIPAPFAPALKPAQAEIDQMIRCKLLGVKVKQGKNLDKHGNANVYGSVLLSGAHFTKDTWMNAFKCWHDALRLLGVEPDNIRVGEWVPAKQPVDICVLLTESGQYTNAALMGPGSWKDIDPDQLAPPMNNEPLSPGD